MMKNELEDKMSRSSSFRKQMEKVEQNYRLLCQQAHYSNLSDIDQQSLSKFQNHSDSLEIYFIYGTLLKEGTKGFEKTTLFFVNKFPRPTKPYIMIYINDGVSSNGFNNFKNMMTIMPIEFLVFVEKIFLVKPSFGNKASGFFSFGTITKYINSKVHTCETLQELRQNLGLNEEVLVSFMPPQVRKIFVNQQEQNRILNSAKLLSTSDSLQKKKSEDKKVEIQSYDIGQTGIPQLFQMLIFYFKQHKEGLNSEGIFRKSVSILEEEEAMHELSNKNYNYLDKISDPHVVANLIKRFLAKLQTPVIPYEIFHEMIKCSSYPSEYLKLKMKQLEQMNKVKFLTLVSLIQFFSQQVIPLKDQNKMTVQNISICIAPCLMWAEERSLKDIIYSTLAINILGSLIKEFQAIFGDKKAQKKIFRSSYLSQKKKSLTESFGSVQLKNVSSEESNHTNQVSPIRQTESKKEFESPRFSFIEQVEEESQESIQIEEQIMDINENDPMKISVKKAKLKKVEGQKEKEILFKAEQKQISLKQQSVQLQNYYIPKKKRKNHIFSSALINKSKQDKSGSSHKSTN